MTYIDALILGIVEGITEFLPISSTGHLILTAKLLALPDSDTLKSFAIIIQLGAILAVVVLYFEMLLKKWNINVKILSAFLPTALIGLLVHETVKEKFLGNEMVVLWSMLLGGIVLIVFETLHKEKPHAIKQLEHISFSQALTIGVFQSVSIIPGVSRAAATIIGGMWVGLNRKTIVDFSFLLAVPTMVAATGLDLFKSYETFTQNDWFSLLIGFITSFLVALFAIKWLLRFIKDHTFIPFGIYRIIVAILFWFFII